jgi:hypothetical protein
VPKEDDFDTYEQYQDALIDYKADVKIEKKLAEYRAEQEQNTTRAKVMGFATKLVEEGSKKYEDFADKCTADGAPNLPLTEQMLSVIQDMDNPVEVVYHLGNNVNVCASIARMTPAAQARELTKIDLAATKAAPAAPSKSTPTTSAPAPITPTRSENVVTKDPEKMTQAEYEQWRRDGGGGRA